MSFDGNQGVCVHTINCWLNSCGSFAARCNTMALKAAVPMEIFTDDTRSLVICDLLAYLWVKLDTVPKDTLVKIVSDYYEPAVIRKSRDLLYDVAESLVQGRKIKHVKDVDNVSAMYDIMQTLATKSDGSIVFLCGNLMHTPPIEMKNIDCTALLGDTNRLRQEVSGFQDQQTAMATQLTEIVAAVSNIQAMLKEDYAPVDRGQKIVDLLQSDHTDNSGHPMEVEDKPSRQQSDRWADRVTSQASGGRANPGSNRCYRS